MSVNKQPEEVRIFGVNDAVLDWKILRGAERPFTSLASLVDILCLFSIVEATAIYDTLWVAPEDIAYFDALKPLVDKKIVAKCPTIPDKLSDPEVEEQFKSVANMLRYGEFARLSEVGTVDEVAQPTYARYFFASNQRIDSILDPVLTSYVPLVKQESTRTLVSRLSKKLSDVYRQEVEDLVEGGAPIPFYIPPAPAVALDRSCGNRDRLISEILAIRDEFASFRNKYAQYQAVISNPGDYTLSETSEAIRQGFHEVEAAIEDLGTPRTSSRLVSDLLEVDVAGSDSGLSISKGFGSLAKGLWQSLKTRIVKSRAQCLFDLWQNANNVRGYDTMLNRHFDLEGSALTNDVDLVRQLGVWIDRKIGIERKPLEDM